MNERILELKEQATVETPIGHGIVKYVFSPEKFAELIVKECADRIRFCIKNDIDFIAEDIEKHFGVEE